MSPKLTESPKAGEGKLVGRIYPAEWYKILSAILYHLLRSGIYYGV